MALPISPRNVSLVISALFLNFPTSNVAKVFPADKSTDCGSDRQAFSGLPAQLRQIKWLHIPPERKHCTSPASKTFQVSCATMVGFK